MPRKRKTDQNDSMSKFDYVDIIFSFKGCCIDVEFQDDVYDEDEQAEIKRAVNQLAREFQIDKSYVDFKGSKYEKTFMREKGWIELCKLVLKTNMTTNCTKNEQIELLVCYEMMIVCYLYQCLHDLGYDLDAIKLQLKEKTRFYSLAEIDKIQSWKHYPGKWQTWDQSKFTS